MTCEPETHPEAAMRMILFPPSIWEVREDLPLWLAEQLLDLLDNEGRLEREVSLGSSGVTVRWRASA